MGRIALEGMREVADEDTALRWHLFSNHFPPLPEGVLGLAKRVLKAWREGRREAKIDIAEVGRHRTYGTVVPIGMCVREWHLEGFLDDDDNGEGDSE